MILPIVPYGDPVLRKVAEPVSASTPGIQQLVADMYETMYNAEGVGLAAPQVGYSYRLFVVDTTPMAERNETPEAEFLRTFKQTFLNARVLHMDGEPWAYDEGCLSIPGIREAVARAQTVRLTWQDETWAQHEGTFSGLAARVILHEYDHIEGKLFVDHVSPLRRQMLRGKLSRIQRGFGEADYPLRKLAKAR